MEYPKTSLVSNGLLALQETGSTNQDLLALAQSKNHPEFFTLITEFQTAGRGRLNRTWQADPGSSVMASVLLRPSFKDHAGIGWLSLMMAEAIRIALADLGIESKIKWPNDVLVNGLKISGVLAEANKDLSVVVVGFGINVNQNVQQLPTSFATSLVEAGSSSLDRDHLLAQTLANFKQLYLELMDAGGDALASDLRARIIASSATIGELVEVSFPDGTSAVGEAIGIDEGGRLQVKTSSKTLTVSAGDVLHLRTSKRED
jgi:BirA family transcriptional regulator, biotin operon repressor / biotin---[acetyl-CoA-carboxylase] ligase